MRTSDLPEPVPQPAEGLAARLQAQHDVGAYLLRYGCVADGGKRPRFYHPQYELRWEMTTLHLLIYRRVRRDTGGFRKAWGEPVAKMLLTDLVLWMAWYHRQVGTMPATALPHPVDLPAYAEEVAEIGSVEKAVKATGLGYRKKIVWDE